MKKQNWFLTLLLMLAIWPGASTAQAQSPVTVGAWGNNESSQTTVPVAARAGVIAIAAGNKHSVALKDDGSVVAWGDNDFGQTDVPIRAQSGVTAIGAGFGHTVGLKNDGSIVAWGYNDFGQTTVPVAAQSGVTAIGAGFGHTVALKDDGSVVAWGDNQYGQTDVPIRAQSGVMAIAAGSSHTVALKNDGSVMAWGNNTEGQTTVPVGLARVTAIAAGDYHTVALKSDGSVVAWGRNRESQTTAPLTAQRGVTAIAAAFGHTVALKSDGSVLSWGDLDQTTVPLGLGKVTAISAGTFHTVVLAFPTAPTITALPASQTVTEWRSASFDVTGAGFPLYHQWRKDGVDLAGAISATYRLPFAHTTHTGNYTVVVSNPAGSVTSAPPAVLTVNAITAPGAVVAWGANASGQLDVPAAAQSGVTAIAAGGIHYYGDRTIGYSLALKEDGSVVAWGTNNNASVGDPYYYQSQVPIAAQSGVTAISAADFHAVALKNDGTVVAWGANGSGQVTGTPATDEPYSVSASPVTLNGEVLRDVKAVAAAGLHTFAVAGVGHTVALKNDGTVAAWGNNYFGQVAGTPMTNDPSSAIANPVTLDGQVLSGVTAIAARGFHTVALKSDGTVVAWGANGYGEVTGTPPTNGPYFATANPVTLGGQVLKGVMAIAAGAHHTVALKNDGTVAAWGANFAGRVTGTAATLNDPQTEVASPVTLDGQILSGVMAIAAGGYCTVALKDDGTVVAWGANYDGQVTGTSTGFNPAIANPVKLGGQVLSGVTAIAASYIHTVALLGAATPLPSLTAIPKGNEIIPSWPTNAVGFTLQSTTNLAPPVTWIDYSNPYAVLGGRFTVTNSVSGTARFYRLLKR